MSKHSICLVFLILTAGCGESTSFPQLPLEASGGNGGAGGGAGAGNPVGAGGEGGASSSSSGEGGGGGCERVVAFADIEASADATLAQATPGVNAGTSERLTLTRWETQGMASRRAVVAFDIALPDAIVEDAQLCLHLDGQAPFDFAIAAYPIFSAWDEGMVSWNEPWEEGGGDLIISTATPQNVAVFTPAGTEVCWDVTGDLGLEGPIYGWLLKDDAEPRAGGGETLLLASRESATVANRPRLTIAYTTCR